MTVAPAGWYDSTVERRYYTWTTDGSGQWQPAPIGDPPC